MPTKRLPANADIDHLKHQAKDLLKSMRAGTLAACQRFREFHPKCHGLSDAELVARDYSLSDALLAIAREYGYQSWPRLKTVVAEEKGDEVELTLNERIEDPVFLQALDFLDEGDVERLRAHLAAHPGLVHQQVIFEGGNYFQHPTLLEFVAESPTRNETLPANIVEVTEVILKAGARENIDAMNYTLGLVGSGRIPRECGVEEGLLRVLCDHGADPGSAMHTTLAHGEFDAARTLIALGAPLDLPAAAALGDEKTVRKLLPDATQDDKQLALAMAVIAPRNGCVALLLDGGADPNRYNPPGGHSHCTALHSAVWEGYLSTVKLMVERGARYDIGDIHHNATAVSWATYAGHEDIVAYFASLPSA